jgi:hypothetical protein
MEPTENEDSTMRKRENDAGAESNQNWCFM